MSLGGHAVPDFILLHLLDNAPGAIIPGGQFLQMIFQVRFHLALGFRHEPEIRPNPGPTSDQTQSKGTCVPEWIEQARTAVQFSQPLAAPRKVIDLLARSGLQELDRFLILAHRRLPAIQGLRTDLADVIDAHEASGVLTLRIVAKVGFIAGTRTRRVGPAGGDAAAKHLQGDVEFGDHRIKPADLATQPWMI